MRRWLFFAYGVLCYSLFFGIFAYMAGFVGGFLVPKTIDTPSSMSPAWAATIDLGLIAMFAMQHSIMARPAFKRIWTRVVPHAIERSTYCLFSCVVSALMMWQWQAIDVAIWHVEDTAARAWVWVLFAAGWLLVPAVSFMIHHFDLFGIRQVWLYLRGKPYTALPFRTPMLYSRIRHPLYIGWAIAFWATPTMTLGHLLFAAAMTLYMGLAAIVEERDLVSYFGEKYRAYQKRVPMFVPRFGGSENAKPKCREPGEECVSRGDASTESRWK
jgi:protein-S-isoprenylcysteine O-methyltransferase Ste14